MPSERSWKTSGRLSVYSFTLLQSGEWTTSRWGQELPARRKVCTGVRGVPLPFQELAVGGHISRLRKTGASSSQTGSTLKVAVFGTCCPSASGKYQRPPTNRSMNSCTPQAVPSERTVAPTRAASWPTIKTWSFAVLMAKPSTGMSLPTSPAFPAAAQSPITRAGATTLPSTTGSVAPVDSLMKDCRLATAWLSTGDRGPITQMVALGLPSATKRTGAASAWLGSERG